MIKQKEAVYNAVMSFYKDSGRAFEEGVAVELTADERKTIIHMVTQGITAGDVEMRPSARKKHDTSKKMHNYVTGLVGDRLRKDKRLNGNVPHQVKKPGSRAGAGDKAIKELRSYKKNYCKTPEQRAEADKAIERRLQEILNEKLKKTNINMELVNTYLQTVE